MRRIQREQSKPIDRQVDELTARAAYIELIDMRLQRQEHMIDVYAAHVAEDTNKWDSLDVSKYIGIDGLVTEPSTVLDAQSRTDWPRWDEAIKTEKKHITVDYPVIGAPEPDQWFEDNGIVNKPTPIGIIFKVKYLRGKIDKYKVRMVLRGTKHFMRPDIDFEDSFSASPSMVTVRLILALVVLYDLNVRNWDVIAAYLNAVLPEKERLPVILPKGLQDICKDTGRVLMCPLDRALYGHPVSDKAWNETCKKWGMEFFNSKGWSMVISECDTCLWIITAPSGNTCLMIIYIDDCQAVGKVDAELKYIETGFQEQYGVRST